MNNTKLIIIAIVVICIVVASYSWHKKNKAMGALEQLKSTGASIDLSILSYPIIAIDKNKQIIFLVNGNGASAIVKLPFVSIGKIQLIETPAVSTENNDPRGPDTAIITTLQGQTYQVRELPDNASKTFMMIKAQEFPESKLALKQRR